MKKEQYVILSINGGAGKNVMATAVVKAIKKAYPDRKIIVLTAYKDVWMNNPDVWRSYNFGQTPYFYSDFIEQGNSIVFAQEPYQTNDYIQKKKHLIEIWCDLCGVPYNKEKPELFFNQREVDYVKNRLLGAGKRPIFAIQTNGGMQQDVKISWMRDMPLDMAQEIVNHYAQWFDVIHIRRQDQLPLNNTLPFTGNLRELFLLIKFSTKRLLIDSLSQHVAAALNKQSTVLWVRNNPKILGYTMHDNIVTPAIDELDTTFNSVLEPYEITGNVFQCPFKEGTVLFDKDEVIESIKAQINVEEKKPTMKIQEQIQEQKQE